MADTTTQPAKDADPTRYMVRLAVRLRADTVSRFGYLFPAAFFPTGEHAERFGMCLWTSKHRNVVALHVFPPVRGRTLAPDGWSIAEPIHVKCGPATGSGVPAIVVAPGGRMWVQESSRSVRAG